MQHKTSHLSRRALVKAGGVMGSGIGLALIASHSAIAQATQAPIKENHQPERKNEMMSPNNSEPNLSSDDPTLSPRIRELIRIGEIGIARENQAAMAKFFNPDFWFHGPDGNVLTRVQLWDYFAACRAAFDDFAVTRQQIFSDGGNHLAARTTFSGVFARPFTASPIGTIQPNGKPVFFKINNVFRYAANGTLIEEWAQYDSRLFLERLGVRLTP
jgi:predicted ester cyclase